jgi:multiple sugar transport system ATP-binding protein
VATISFDHVSKVYDDGTRAVDDLSFEVEHGELVILVGPSGCGKTTALRMIAGLESVTDGEIRIGDRVVNDLGPRERDIAMVFQNYALYPHMTVYDNIGFGLRMRRVPKPERRGKIESAARILGLSDHLDRKPGKLSGGQRQRVAMGRAIVREPQAFLMDEPLSNLDAKLRVQMRTEISRIQRELDVTMLYVTHDQIEAMTMGDRVVVLRRGIVQQIDTPQRLYDSPANLFVASFIGSPAMNLLEATVESRDGGAVCRIGPSEISLPARLLDELPALARYFGETVGVGVRPEHVGEASRSPNDTGCVHLLGTVRTTEALGPELLAYVEVTASPVVRRQVIEGLVDLEETAVVADIRTEGGPQRATVVGRLPSSSPVRAGEPIELAVDLNKLQFFDLDDGSAIAA